MNEQEQESRAIFVMVRGRTKKALRAAISAERTRMTARESDSADQNLTPYMLEANDNDTVEVFIFAKDSGSADDTKKEFVTRVQDKIKKLCEVDIFSVLIT